MPKGTNGRWERHAALLEEARKELGPKCPAIYSLEECWLAPSLLTALAAGSPEALRQQLVEVCRDSANHAVYRLELFTKAFCEALLEELEHLEGSGIPLRRPNGMNRHGAILSQLGFQEELLLPLVRRVMLPFSRLLWPEWVGPDDCDETYGFVVRYRLGGDVELAEHTDTSNVTLNACIGRDFEGGDLVFRGVRFTSSQDDATQHRVAHKPGWALLHLGGHSHGAEPLTGGDRCNLILWATAAGGTVRIRPTTPRGTLI